MERKELTPAEPGKDEKDRNKNDEMEILMREVLHKRDDNLRGEFKHSILGLLKPEREDVQEILPDTKRDEPTIVSRSQPTDPLYYRLHRDNPRLKEWRTPDLDHWNAQWLRGYIYKDVAKQEFALQKLGEVSGLGRAVTTYAEGALVGGNETAILDGSAGDLLPQPFANVVMIARDEVAVMAGLVQPITMTSATLRVPTADAFSVEMVAEGATATAAGPTAASTMMKVEKMAGFAKVTLEALADAAFNVIGILSTRAGTAMGALEDVQICTTDGTPPNISAKIVGVNVAEATSTVLIYEDLVTLLFALGKVYRTNAVWLANSVTLTLVSTLMNGNSQPILQFPNEQPNVISDAPGAIGTMFRKPVFEVPLADGELIFGDPAGYVFARRQGLTIASSTESSFSSDVVDLKFTQRIDGQLIDTVALVQMSGLATVA